MKRVAALLFALSSAPAMALEPPAVAPAGLFELLNRADSENPAIRAARAEVEAARLVPSQVEAPPDPEVSVSYVNDGISGFTLGETEFSAVSLVWTQEVPYPGKLHASADTARATAEAVSFNLERTRLEVRAAVKTAYADLYRIDRAVAILDETRSVLVTLVAAARARYEVGQGILESVLKAQTEIVRLDAEQARLSEDRRAVEARFDAAIGCPVGPLAPIRALPHAPVPAESQELADLAVTTSPEATRAEILVRAAEAQERRARLDLKPDLIWGAAYQYRGALDPMVMAMVGLRLPLYRERKQAQALAQAGFERSRASHGLDQVRLDLRRRVHEQSARARRASRLVILYEQGVIPQARGALDSAQASYGVGRIAFLDLLNDLTVLLEARIELAAQEAERVQALAALEPLVGRELVPVSDPATPPEKGRLEGSSRVH